MTMTCVAECTAINKKTRAKMFSDVKVGDAVMFSVPISSVGSNRGRSYAVGIKCVNVRTKDVTTLTFNEIGRILDCFEFEQKN